MTAKLCSLSVLILLLAGCTSMGQLGRNTAPPSQNESIFILGVSPANHRVSFFRGSVDDGRFVQNLFLPSVLYSAAVDGFVVGRAAAGDVIAVTIVRVVSSENSVLLGSNFSPCGEAKTIVFRVPAGKVAYLGSVEFAFSESELKVWHGSELERAQAYVASRFPALSGRVEYVPFELLPVKAACGGKTYVPVYVPRPS
jgi:hypothetical protein